MSVGREPARAGDGLPQQRQPACASPPSCRRPNRRSATLTRSLSGSSTALPSATFGGRYGRRKPLGAERRQTPLLAQLRQFQLDGSWMGPEAAPAAASWRLWGSSERRRRCAFATSACGTSRGGSSVQRPTKAGTGFGGSGVVPGARRSLADHFRRLAQRPECRWPSRFILPEAKKKAA